ncbi:lead, cadmium, zinc and mercury transporting ATPase [Piscinibacter sakaiensis]|uniref:Lead, cadmium, zinc and mercury transporting ATPase n=2 Tax=Piscinibacter sakaiensis TaxID=1547922 RepID=A0A0K8NVD5_PISS1|nr:lead, cadmium, zinc and mercury transporting ATPase [Piscinibacter sakaiensis]
MNKENDMAEPLKLRLDIRLLLPSVTEVQDPCVQRLVQALAGRDGISTVHVADAQEAAAPQLCIHYDPKVLSLSRVRELAHAAGAQLSDRFGHLLLRTSTLHARAARTLTSRVQALAGVVEAEVTAGGAVRIEFDRQQTTAGKLDEALREMGLDPQPSARAQEPAGTAPDSHDHRDGHTHGHDKDHQHDHDHQEEHGRRPAGTVAQSSAAKAHDHGADDHGAEHGDEAGHGGHSHEHGGGLFGERTELVFALLAGAAVLVGWLLEWRGLAPQVVSTGLYVAAYVFGGYYTLKEAIENIRAKRFEIDTLMLVAAAGAAALGEWAEGGLLLFLFSLGHSLEHYAMGRARKAIEALAKLAPETAQVRRDDARVEEVRVEALQVGDVVIVRPNERLPADGFVVQGQSSVNQAPVTGESVPVDKQPVDDREQALQGFDKLAAAHRVFAGTINGSGVLEVMVARRSSESTMARVVKLVTEAETQRSPTQNFTEKFERIFVPAVLVLVVLLMFAGLVIDEPFSASFYRAMAVLVAASPCALAISVPSAVLSGVARAGRSGVLVKGGGPLENLGTLTAIAFDKTGTLTEGKPRLVDVVPAQPGGEEELLAVALAVEEHSDHPLASAIVQGARERLQGKPQQVRIEGLQSITGRGLKARLGAEEVHLGKAALFDEVPGRPMPVELTSANERLMADGRTTMVLRVGERYLGVLGVMDTPRPAAATVMRQLQELGIQRLIMISGDNQRVAESVARSVGLTEARGDLMPEQKVDAIKALRVDAGKVAMVGDGVNDAPAMANATVGIAMGAAGSDVALETADVALMADDLAQLPFAVGLSRRTSRVIRQNLWVSLGVVAVLIPSTILGLNIGTAVLFHEGSTLLVVMNALRLLTYEFKAALPPPQTAPETAAQNV